MNPDRWQPEAHVPEDDSCVCAYCLSKLAFYMRQRRRERQQDDRTGPFVNEGEDQRL